MNHPSCIRCRRQFAPGEQVYRLDHLLRIYCRECTAIVTGPWAKGLGLRFTYPCEGCARPVCMTRRWSTPFCSEHCRKKAALARRRAQRAAARASKVCMDCGNHFELSRSDARFCSAACKQRSYRKTKAPVTDDGSIELRSETVNATIRNVTDDAAPRRTIERSKSLIVTGGGLP